MCRRRRLSRALDELVEFAAIKPDAAAPGAEIDFDSLPFRHHQFGIVGRTFHVVAPSNWPVCGNGRGYGGRSSRPGGRLRGWPCRRPTSRARHAAAQLEVRHRNVRRHCQRGPDGANVVKSEDAFKPRGPVRRERCGRNTKAHVEKDDGVSTGQACRRPVAMQTGVSAGRGAISSLVQRRARTAW